MPTHIDLTWLRNPSPRVAQVLKVFRFLVVGGFNTLFGYSLYALLLWAGLPLEIALLLATIVGVLFNFVSYGKFAFGGPLTGVTLVRFIGNYVVQYIIGVALLRLMVGGGYSAYIAPVLLLPITITFNFFAMRYFVFPVPTDPRSQS